MQFKLSRHKNKSAGGVIVFGNTLHCLRLMPGNPRGGRRPQKIITILDRWAPELPPEARKLLTPEEQREWAEWKARHDDEQRRAQLAAALDAASGAIYAAAAALREKVAKATDPAALWSAIDELTDELERAGHARPKRPRGRPRVTAEKDRPQPVPLPPIALTGADILRQYQLLHDTFGEYQRLYGPPEAGNRAKFRGAKTAKAK